MEHCPENSLGKFYRCFAWNNTVKELGANRFPFRAITTSLYNSAINQFFNYGVFRVPYLLWLRFCHNRISLLAFVLASSEREREREREEGRWKQVFLSNGLCNEKAWVVVSVFCYGWWSNSSWMPLRRGVWVLVKVIWLGHLRGRGMLYSHLKNSRLQLPARRKRNVGLGM